MSTEQNQWNNVMCCTVHNDLLLPCGQDSWNFLENDMTTHIGGASPVEVALAFKFATVSRNIQQVCFVRDPT